MKNIGWVKCPNKTRKKKQRVENLIIHRSWYVDIMFFSHKWIIFCKRIVKIFKGSLSLLKAHFTSEKGGGKVIL